MVVPIPTLLVTYIYEPAIVVCADVFPNIIGKLLKLLLIQSIELFVGDNPILIIGVVLLVAKLLLSVIHSCLLLLLFTPHNNAIPAPKLVGGMLAEPNSCPDKIILGLVLSVAYNSNKAFGVAVPIPILLAK
ncbi:MAG: hypothetical protein EBU03_06395 [Methylophilaceae bacterium]|nr:hypothetical protein [Methylophilaceae bacterium]